MRKRVVVVDDDDICRRGMAETLSDDPSIEVIASVNHTDAATWTSRWHRVDVAVVDAADERDHGDHFPGVAVVETIRRHRFPAQTAIIVITGHFFDDAVRRRMREAQADYFFHRSEIADARNLVQAIVDPSPQRRGVPPPLDPEALHRLGVIPTSQVNDAVRYLREHGRVPGGLPVSASRRASERVRGAFNQNAHLRPTNRDGTEPERDQKHPSNPQRQRFLEWATKTKHN